MKINEKGVTEHLVEMFLNLEIAKQGYRTKKSTKKGLQNTRGWGGPYKL